MSRGRKSGLTLLRELGELLDLVEPLAALALVHRVEDLLVEDRRGLVRVARALGDAVVVLPSEETAGERGPYGRANLVLLVERSAGDGSANQGTKGKQENKATYAYSFSGRSRWNMLRIEDEHMRNR